MVEWRLNAVCYNIEYNIFSMGILSLVRVAYKIFVKGGLWPPHDILFFYMYIINMTTDDRNYFRKRGGIMSKPEWKFGYIQPDCTIIWKKWSELTE